MSKFRALALGMLGLLGFVLILLVLFSGNASATDPMFIENDSGLEQAESDNNCTGLGTEDFPYVFKDYQFNGSGYGYGFWLQNTSYHVRLVNCTFNNSYYENDVQKGIAIFLNNCSNVTIVDCTVTTSIYGIIIDSSDNCTVERTNVTGIYGSEYGVGYDSSENCVLHGVTVTNVYRGVYISNSSLLIVSWSNISYCMLNAMFIQDSNVISIHNNTLIDAGSDGLMIRSCTDVEFRKNMIDINGSYQDGLVINDADGPIDISDCHFINSQVINGALWILSAANVTVDECVFDSSTLGVKVDQSNNITIVNCDLSSNTGVTIYKSRWVEMIGNRMINPVSSYPRFANIGDSSFVAVNDSAISGVADGIHVTGSHFVVLNNTQIDHMTSSTIAISLQNSDNLTVSWSVMSDHAGEFISLEDCDYFSIHNNSISNGTYGGVNIGSLCDHGEIANNTLVNFTTLGGQSMVLYGKNITVIGNTFTQLSGFAIYIRLVDSVIVGNTVENAVSSFWLSYSKSVLVVDNYLCENGHIGITDSSDIHLVNNDILNAGNTHPTQAGIEISTSRSCWIVENTISGSYWYGIKVEANGQSMDIHLEDNVIDVSMTNEYGAGIYVKNVRDIDLSGNSVTGDLLYGIFLEGVGDCRIIGNDVTNADNGLYATSLYDALIDSNDLMSSADRGMYIAGAYASSEFQNTTIVNNRISGAQVCIDLSNAGYAALNENVCTDFTLYGIRIWTSYFISLINNNCSGLGSGVGLEVNDCLDYSILGGTYNNSNNGVVLSNSPYGSVSSVNSSFNSNDGLYIYNGESVIITDSTFSNNYNGITAPFGNPNDVDVSNCRIENNSNHGIRFDDGSMSDIVGNHIANNAQYGVYLSGMSGCNIYGNMFLNNCGTTGVADDWPQAWDDYYVGGNLWYSAVNLGNAWSNLLNLDVDEDGVVDIEYQIGGAYAIYDSYPLPYGPKIECPSAPTNLSYELTSYYIHLNWTAPTSLGNSTLMGYKVYMGPVNDFESMTEAIGDPGDRNFTVKNGLINGYTYYFAVAGYNEFEMEGDPSNILAVHYNPFPTPNANRIVIHSNSDFALKVFDGDGSEANPYIIENLIFDGTEYDNCIEIWYTDAHFIVRNCVLYFGALDLATMGIDLDGVTNGKFENCTFSGPMITGVNAYESQFEMSDCTFDGSFNYAITLGMCFDVNVHYSNFSGAGTALNIVGSHGILIENDTFEDNGNGASVYGGDAITIRNNDFTGGSGLYADDVDGFVIENNNWIDVRYMVDMWSCSGLMIGNNTANGMGTDDGLDILDCDGARIANNQLIGFRYGSTISESSYVTFLDNTLKDNYRGADFYNGPHSTIIGNEFSSNGELGLLLAQNCNGMLVEKNRFLNNVLFGLTSACYGATITLNYFDGNNGNDGTFTELTMQGSDQSATDQWQRDGFGNYWSDWTSPDDDGDGIVDLSYGSGEFETDLYPLVNQFGMPTGLRAAVGPNYVNITWGELNYDFTEGVDGYYVYRGLVPNAHDQVWTTSSMWYNDTSVTLGTEYYYWVTAYKGVDEGARSDWIFAIPCEAPGIPTGLTVEAGLREFYLSWIAPAENGGSPILGYEIWRGPSPSSLVLIDTVGTSVTYTDPLVGDNETWYYAVAAFNQAGTGTSSETIGNTTFSCASAPLNVTTQFGNGNVTVFWDAPLDDGGTPITGYVIEFGIYPNFDFVVPGANYRHWLITGLTNGLEYSFRVLADNIVLTTYYQIGAEWSSTVYDTPATVPGVPEDLMATTGTGVVRLSWSPPTDDGGDAPSLYNVYRMEIGGAWALIDDSAILMYNDSDVTNGVAYFYRISAVNKAGEGNVSEPVRGVPGLPSPPLDLLATNSAGKVQLNWTAPADNGGSALLGYKVYRDGGSGFAYLGLVGPGSLGYLDVSAAPGIVYGYRVTAVSGNGEGVASNEALITLPLVSPEAPVIESAVQGNEGVLIVWHVPESSTVPDEFWVYRSATNDALSMRFINNVTGNMREYLDIGGSAGMFYALRSFNQYGVSELSGVFNATPRIVIAPSAPQGLTAMAGDSIVTLSWTASTGSIGYHIYRDNGTGYALLATLAGTEYVDNEVLNGVPCSYRITAYNDGGESGNSTTVLATPGTVPGVVQNLTLTEGEAIVTLNWDAPSDNGGYAVQAYRVYRDLNGTVTMLAMVTSMTYADHNVVSELQHSYWIVALNAWGAGAESARVNVTPDQVVITGLPAPSYLLASIGNGSVTLTWDPMTSFGVSGFRVFRSDGGNFTRLAAQLGSTFTDTGLVNGVTYTYRVHCFIGTSNGTFTYVNATPGKAPEAPTLNGQEVVDRFTLSWSVPGDGGYAIVGYRLYRTPGTGTNVLLASLTGTEYVDTTVLAGVNYTYMVTAFNAFGEGAPSNTKVLRTSQQTASSTDVPAEPYFSSAVGGNISISLLWNVPSDTGDGPITGYNVYRGTSPLAAQLLVSVPAGTSTYVDGTTVYGTTYYYWVSALNQWGESGLSRALSASLIVLAVPGEVDIEVTVGQGRITISWSAPDEGSSAITAYNIYRRGETGERQLIATVPAGTDTFVDGSVEAGLEYDYWVTAVNAAGEGPLADTPVSGIPLAIIAGEAEIGPLPTIALALGAIGLLVAIVAVVLVLRRK